MENRIHIPVMLEEAITALAIRPGGRYVDGTAGGGGHLAAILDQVGESGLALGIDRDPDAIGRLKNRFSAKPNLLLRQANFSEIDQVLAELEWEAVDGMLLDLGLSSHQLEISGRGFSFDRDEPLDMRMNPDDERSAYELVNRLPEKELADLIYRYGEERASRRIARAIVWSRKNNPIETSAELASVVRKSLYRPGVRHRLDPATRTFQALRLAVNLELESLENFLNKAPTLIRPGGRLVVISFHSLEDRQVKMAFKAVRSGDTRQPTWRALHKKPVRPSEAEEAANPRARSARLRVGERIQRITMSKVFVENISRPGQLTLRKINRRSDESHTSMQIGRFLPALIGSLLLVAFAMAYVWTNHTAVQVGYEISALHQEQTRLTELNRKFKAELANLTSLERLETVAKTQLGLVQPTRDQVREIK